MEFKINPCYMPLLEDQNRYLILFGGAGSGKSVFAAQKILTRVLTEEGHRFLVLRKVANTLRPSVWNMFLKLIKELSLSEEFQINKNDFKITHLPTQNEITFSGLDDPEKIKSVTDITGLWLEEATEFTSEDLMQLDLRLRGETPNYKQIILSFNPVSEDHWLKADFFDQEVDECTILKSTYKDNVFIDEQYKRTLEKRVKKDENLYRIYVLGEWGQESSENNFYKDFRTTRHLGATQYNPELPLHISWDFNINPSCSLLIWQTQGHRLFCIDEIQLEYPRNLTKDICREFASRYRDHKGGCFIYGDPNGRKGDTRSEAGYNDYSIVQKELRQFNPSLRIAMKAPPVHIRGMFINSVFDGEFQDCFVTIDHKCKGFIADLNYLKQQSDGTKLKQTTKVNGIVFEKYGHLSDCFDYFICQYLNALFMKFQRGSEGTVQPQHGRNKWNSKMKW